MRVTIPILTLLASASMAGAQDVDILRSSLQSGNERLALFSASKFIERQPDPNVLRLLGQLMPQQGFNLDGTRPDNAILSSRANVAPIVAYDDNINGGNRNSSFTLGEVLTFTVDENARAKEGVVLGGAINASLRYGYGRGDYLDVAGSYSAVHAPRENLEKYTYGFSICSRNHLQGWSFLDGCATTQSQEVDLGTTREDALRLTGTQLFQAGGYDHAASGTIGRTWFSDFEQDTFAASLSSSLGDFGSGSATLDLGEDVADTHTLRERLTLNYVTTIADRLVGFSVSRGSARGSSFLGDVREDTTTTFGVRTTLTDQLSANIRFTDNRSTVDFFEYSSVSVGFGINGFSF